jgi:myo-inositol-1(or 4)-monophosphatase
MMIAQLNSFLAAAQDAARQAGQVLLAKLDSATVREKSPKDLVTDADVAAQRVIRQALLPRFPDHRFLGEELDLIEEKIELDHLPADAYCWVVDPIDGTANYVHRLPNFAVSIALVRRGRTEVGIVYDPMADEMFSAILGGGAQLNNRPIQATACVSLEQALIAASFPPSVRRDSIEIQQFIEVLLQSQSIRRLGSAALNLCYVGCGRLDGYWAGRVQAWDIAAGALIATEAGAVLTARDGGEFKLTAGNLTIAATLPLHRQLTACLDLPLSAIEKSP